MAYEERDLRIGLWLPFLYGLSVFKHCETTKSARYERQNPIDAFDPERWDASIRKNVINDCVPMATTSIRKSRASLLTL